MKNASIVSFYESQAYFWPMKNKTEEKLIFVYNANSGARNAILDSVHKMMRPSTYKCNLCDITYGLFWENRKWKHFRQESAHQMTFLYKDAFLKQYASKFGHKFDFPVVLVEADTDLEILVSTQELNTLQSPQELIELVQERTAH